MTGNFDPNRHRLDARESEALWADIREQATRPREPRSAFAPALAATALIVTVGALGALFLWPGSGDKHSAQRTALSAPGDDYADIDEPVLLDRATGRPVPVLEVLPALSSEDRDDEGSAGIRPAPPPAPAAVRGEVRDAVTGDVLGWTNVAVIDANSVDGVRRAVSDSVGAFLLDALVPDEPVTLRFARLGFAPVDTTFVPAEGETLVVALELRPVVVAQLDNIDVPGAAYMIETKGVTTEQRIDPERLSKYAIDSVEEARAKQFGVVDRGGQTYVRGGRSGEVSMRSDGGAAGSSQTKMLSLSDASAVTGSVTGGTTPPNGEPYELMYFEHVGVNPFVPADEDALSTFAVDVDDASYKLARSYLERGHLPPPEAIRVEEFVNVFDGDWPEQSEDDLRIHVDGAPSRFADGYHLLRVGLRARTVQDEDRKPALLIFVVDVSGSMRQEDRLGLVKEALYGLVDELEDADRVGLVVYGSRGRVVLEPTGVEHRGELLEAIGSLAPDGSTNAEEGLDLGYAMARENAVTGQVTRLILCSDGVANTGETRAQRILANVRKAADRGIHLTTVGFGMGNYNDVLMEKLADTGDGNYSYVDDLEEARRTFRENLTGTLQTVARDTKIQVEFDPDAVVRWRLLGYENRDVADRDFRNDDVDAGEVGSGHVVTALYEVKLTDAMQAALEEGDDGEDELAVVRARWEVPAHETDRAGEVHEIERRLALSDLSESFSEAASGLRLQATAAEFAEILRKSYWAKESTFAALVPVADAVAAERPGDEKAMELAALVRKAAELESENESD